MIEVPPRKTCRANGIDASYLEQGAGTPLLMIHGMLANALDYMFQFSEFSGRYRCIAPDVRGSGRTRASDPKDASLDIAVEDLLDFIVETIPVDKPFILVGHSYGGLISLEIINRIPERIAGFVIISSPATLPQSPLAPFADLFLPLIPVFLGPLLRVSPAIELYTKCINMSPRNMNDELRKLLDERNSLLLKEDVHAMRKYLESIFGLELAVNNSAAQIPSMLVYGDHDIMFTRKDVRLIQKFLPGITCHKIRGTGHSCMQEKPKEFNKLMNEFLTSIEKQK